MVPLSHPVFLNQVTAHFRAVTIVLLIVDFTV